MAVSYAISALLNRLPAVTAPECICAEISAATSPRAAAASAPMTLSAPTAPRLVASVGLRAGTVAECAAHGPRKRRIGVDLNVAHWLSAGLTSFSRGLNDTPKIVAIGAFALPSGVTTETLLLGVAAAMATGSLAAGRRVARRLAHDVVEMSASEAFRANVTTALLVAVGGNQGLPMSTTHVSTGAIAGIAGTNPEQLNRRTLRHFAIAWTVTPLTAGVAAATIYALIS